MGKLLAEAQGEAITGQLKTSTLNLGYSGDYHCHSHFQGHSRGHSHGHSHCQSHGYSSRVIGSYWIWPLVNQAAITCSPRVGRSSHFQTPSLLKTSTMIR